MSEHEHSTSHGNETVRFEPTDVATRPVALSVLGLAAFTIIFTIAANYVYFGLAERAKATSPAANPLAEQYAAKQPPEPRLQLRPKDDLTQLRAAEEKSLSTLAWVDKEAGVVQVPIERAMEMLIAKGLPARQGEVPASMSSHGEAPEQHAEASGAPDWTGGWKISRDLQGEGGHGEGHAAGSHAEGGQAEAPGHGSAGHEGEAHGH
jgi:hypothetical protein